MLPRSQSCASSSDLADLGVAAVAAADGGDDGADLASAEDLRLRPTSQKLLSSDFVHRVSLRTKTRILQFVYIKVFLITHNNCAL
jgi:hypothetical protein